MITEIYRSASYAPDLVTGRYVRCVGSKRKGYRFRIFETSTGTVGPWHGLPGRGPTLREYETDGADIPDAVRTLAIETKQTVKWS